MNINEPFMNINDAGTVGNLSQKVCTFSVCLCVLLCVLFFLNALVTF